MKDLRKCVEEKITGLKTQKGHDHSSMGKTDLWIKFNPTMRVDKIWPSPVWLRHEIGGIRIFGDKNSL